MRAGADADIRPIVPVLKVSRLSWAGLDQFESHTLVAMFGQQIVQLIHIGSEIIIGRCDAPLFYPA